MTDELIREAREMVESYIKSTPPFERLARLIERMETALTAAQAEAERLKAPVMCSVCCGQPLKSGRECICGGTGTEQAEMHGLRVECFRLEDENATLRAQLAGDGGKGVNDG